MRKPASTNHNHPESYLMGTNVEHEGDDYTVTGLQSGTAVITNTDGFQRHIPIAAIRDNNR